MFDNMDPRKKKLLMIGIPVVIGIAIIFLLKSKSSASAAAGGTLPSSTANPSGVDVGQLAAFESTVSNQLANLQAAQGGSSTGSSASSSQVGGVPLTLSQFLQGVASSPNPTATENFMQANMAAQQAGQASYWGPPGGQPSLHAGSVPGGPFAAAAAALDGSSATPQVA
ncbi:MAG: hypothetical protein ACYCVN_12345 [Acidimicrobiales bacterium]